jgi:hypothetical protein
MSFAADEKSVSGRVHGEEFTGNLVDEVNQTGKLTCLASVEIVEVAAGGPEAVYEWNDLAGDDAGHWTPLEGSSTRAVSAWLARG